MSRNNRQLFEEEFCDRNLSHINWVYVDAEVQLLWEGWCVGVHATETRFIRLNDRLVDVIAVCVLIISVLVFAN